MPNTILPADTYTVINKTILTDNEKEVLIRYIKNESIIKIANDTMQSERTVSRVIADLKEKYNNYKKLEITKLELFQKRQNYDKK